jgi:uncharacterized protein (DUF433 family)
MFRSVGIIFGKYMTPTANPEMLTPTEAAIVSSVDVRDVNRVIDEQILPEDFYKVSPDRTRRFIADACAFISFYFHAAKYLTAEERLRAIVAASPRLREEPGSKLEKEWTIRQEFLTIDLAPFLKNVHEKLAKLGEARDLVVEDHEILSGTPVIRNTRIPVYDVAASVAAGLPMRRILEAYPGLTAEMADLAALYATAKPQRGRPRQHSSPPAGAVIVSTRRTPRRKRIHEAAR